MPLTIKKGLWILPVFLACTLAAVIGGLAGIVSTHAMLYLWVTIPAAAALALLIWRFFNASHAFLCPSTFVLVGFVIFYAPEVYLFDPQALSMAYSEETLLRAGIVLWLGFLAFLAGMLLSSKRALGRPKNFFSTPVSPGKIFLAAMGFTFVGFAAFGVLCWRLGELPHDYLIGFYTEGMWGGITGETRPFLMAMNLAVVGGLLSTHIIWRRDINIPLRLLAIPGILLPLAVFGIRGSRAIVALLLFTVLMSWIGAKGWFTHKKGKQRAKILIAAFAVALSSFVALLTWGRATAWGTQAQAHTEGSFTKSFSYFERLTLTVDMIPTWHPFLWGRTLLAGIVFPIPRAIWQGKPYGFGTVFGEWLGFLPGSVGVPATLAGELYANFSWAGVALGMLLMGWLVKALDDWLPPGTGTSLMPVVFSANAWSCLGMMRGDFQSACSSWIVNLAAIAIAVFWAKNRSTSVHSPSMKQT